MNSIEQEINKAFEVSYNNYKQLHESAEVKHQVKVAAEMLIKAYQNGGCVHAAGNGGSASDAQHFVAELVVKLSKNRSAIKGFAMSTDTSILTACGNDFGYKYIFSRQVEANMGPQDIFFGITTSGNSENIIYALEMCRKKNIKSIVLTGHKGGKARELADHLIVVPGEATAQIQEAHLVVYHSLCWILENELVKSGHVQYR